MNYYQFVLASWKIEPSTLSCFFSLVYEIEKGLLNTLKYENTAVFSVRR